MEKQKCKDFSKNPNTRHTQRRFKTVPLRNQSKCPTTILDKKTNN
jgi:hypothetical protein